MSFNSYSQNFEDVILWRALQHVQNGFYIDIGAQDPLIDSVSLAFYEHGWRGIHVEPTPHYAESLRQERPGDVVIQAAIGEGPEVIRFFEIPDTGISTAERKIADQHRERGFDVREIMVPCVALSAILNICSGHDIHWLKIDVEGFEKQVLSSWRGAASRPWIVVIESTLPMTQIETHESWEQILIDYGYSYVYFDGLNRFYLSDEHAELKSAFSTPPNIFDDFTLNGTASVRVHAPIESRYESKISELLANAELQKQSSKYEIEQLNQHLIALENKNLKCFEALVQRDECNKELSQQAWHAKADIETHLLKQIQQEQTWASHLLNIQQQFANEKIEKLTNQDEQKQAMQHQHSLECRQLQQALEASLIDQLLREKELSAYVQNIHQQLSQEKAELIRVFGEQENSIRRESGEREQAIQLKLKMKEDELIRIMLQNVKNQELHNNGIARSQEKNLHLQQSHELEIKKINEELGKNQNEHNLVIASYETLDALHKVSLQKLDLNHFLQADLQRKITSMQESLTWRMTSPLRGMALLFSNNKVSGLPKNIDLKSDQKLHPQLTSDNIMHTNNEPFMDKTKQVFDSETLIASSLSELLSRHDQHFVRSAYHTMFGRTPDPEGYKYYYDRLLHGTPKIQIIGQMYNSSEASKNNIRLSGLRTQLFMYRLGRMPLFGFFFKLLFKTEADNSNGNRLRVVEQQIFSLNRRIESYFDEAVENYKNIQRTITYQDEKLKKITDIISSAQSQINQAPQLEKSASKYNQMSVENSSEQRSPTSYLVESGNKFIAQINKTNHRLEVAINKKTTKTEAN